MSYLLNRAADFASESGDGFVAAHRDLVRRVPGGVARRTPVHDSQVALVVGGGSGHYPAFAGLVGPGLADAAAMGNVFASPSAHQVHQVARSVAGSAGVLLSYGNYAGDVLNFDQAQERLRAEGIACESVPVTDDIASAPPSESDRRRGIAGDLTVFRAAAWAAAQQRPLAEVAAFARHANERTRTLGVAFTGCTLPGADTPLFTVPAGQMAVGMGIHGEPGIENRPLGSSRELAELLTERLLAERPAGLSETGGRVVLIVNGLGSVKAEELYLLYRDLADLLSAAGLEIVQPEVGEFATSFEMAGVSATLFWLDDDLERAWSAPVYTAAYRKGRFGSPADAELGSSSESTGEPADSTAESRDEADVEDVLAQRIAADRSPRPLAPLARSTIAAIRAAIEREVDELGRLDQVAGDGDHGIGMQRGSVAADEAAAAALASDAGPGSLVLQAADAWADRAGGTSGALWGAALHAVGARLADHEELTSVDLAEAVHAGRDAVLRFGKAEVGDKTMVDSLVPFDEALSEQVGDGVPLAAAWAEAARVATRAAQATADLVARTGRARTHLEASRGTPDPGAVSFALAVTAVGEVLATGESA